MPNMTFSHGPCSHYMNESFLKDGLGLCQIAQFEVGGGVFCDLFPEPRLELEKMVINSWAYYCECVVKICKCEERFALYVCRCDIDGIESWRIVVEDPKEVVVV